MDVASFSLFFAILALACVAAVFVVAAGALVWWVGGRSPALAGLRADLGRVAVPLAWLVATVTTLGSLYFSEVAGFVPCKLCWYQRICMYPLVLVLGVAALRRDRDVRFYVLPLAIVGAVISTYHAWIQAYPPTGGTSFCTLDAPCTERYVWEFGFVSLPLMALSAFAFVITMMVLARPGNHLGSADDSFAELDAELEEEHA